MAKQELVPFKANNLVVQSTSQLPVIVANVEYDKLDDEHYAFSYNPTDDIAVNMIETERPTEETEFIDADFEPGMRESDKPYYVVAACVGLLTGVLSELGLDAKALEAINTWDPKKAKELLVKVSRAAGYKGDKYKGACAFLKKAIVPEVQHVVPAPIAAFAKTYLSELTNHPSLAGLAFSIATQFSGYKYCLDADGSIGKKKVPKYYVRGKTVEEKIFFALFYWVFGLAYGAWASKRMILEELKIPKAILGIIKEFSKSKGVELALGTDKPEEWISKWLKEAFMPSEKQKTAVAAVDAAKEKFDLEKLAVATLKDEYAHITMVLVNECILRAFYFIRKFTLEIKTIDLKSPEQILELDYESLIPRNNRVVTRMSLIASAAYLGVNVATVSVKEIGAAHMGPHAGAKVLLTGINVAGVGYFAYACVADKENIKEDIKVQFDRLTNWRKTHFVKPAIGDAPTKELEDVFSILGLSTDATRLQYSLEALIVEYDIQKSKKDSQAQQKVQWLYAWKEQMLRNLKAEEDYFIADEDLLYEAIYDAAKGKENHGWLYLLAMELALFEPYTPLGKEEDDNWKKLELESSYLNDVFIRRQTLLTQSEADEMVEKYHKYFNTVSGRTKRKVAAASFTVVTTALLGSLAFVFAPQIAIIFAGEAVAGLHGAALANASLAWAGFGALAQGGLGMAGGTAIISGGGTLLGLTSSGATSAAIAMLYDSGKYVYRQAAKMLTYCDCVLSNVIHDREAIQTLLKNVSEVLQQTDIQLDELKDLNDDLQKETIKGLESYVDCLERTEKGLEALA